MITESDLKERLARTLHVEKQILTLLRADDVDKEVAFNVMLNILAKLIMSSESPVAAYGAVGISLATFIRAAKGQHILHEVDENGEELHERPDKPLN